MVKAIALHYLEPIAMSLTKPSDPQRRVLLREPNFLWMMAGGAVSMLGDQFTLIALPWLVLQMTGDTVALGTVLALISIPRALFILIGGAMVDRHSPKQVLMITKYINTLLLGGLAALVFSGALTLPMVYALALVLGLSTAFSIPSASAMMPHVVQAAQLPAANSMMLGLRQLSMFVGPLLAGLLIALFGDGSPRAGLRADGIAVAFAFDAFSFALSAWTLAHVATRAMPPFAGPRPAVWTAVGQGLGHFWRDRELRTCFLYWAAVAVMIMGPIHIAIPVLANSQPMLGAAAMGLMLGAHGAGTLLGMAVSGARPHWRAGSLGLTILLADILIGLLFMPMGQITAIWQGAALMLCIGALGGFIHVAVFTWIQRRVPPVLLGRAMSLFMFIFMGLAPMSAAATGWLMRSITLGQLFAASGAMLVLLAAVAMAVSPMRQVSDAVVQPR